MADPRSAEVTAYARPARAASTANQAAGAQPCQRPNLMLPQAGNWTCRVEMSGSSALPEGPVTIRWGASTLQGYAIRSSPSLGQWVGLVVGGEGGLDQPARAQHYFRTTARRILEETLADAGERLSSSSTAGQAGIDRALNYPRRAIAVQRCLDELCDSLGLVWRVLLDGTVWVGVQAWQPSTATYVYKRQDVAEWSPEIYPDPNQPLVEPGQTVVLDGSASATPFERAAQRVACSEHWVMPSGRGSRLWLVDPAAAVPYDDPLAPDRIHAAFAVTARQTTRGADWYRIFGAEVVQQSANDGTLEVTLNPVMGVSEMPQGISGVAVDVPVGGAYHRVRAGDKCSVYFLGGDFQQPRACGFVAAQTGAGLKAVAIDGSTGTAGTLTLTVIAGVLGGTYVDPDGVSVPVTSGSPINLKCKITGALSPDLKLPT